MRREEPTPPIMKARANSVSIDTIADRKRREQSKNGAAEQYQNLDRLAEVAIRVGLNLAHGQELVMTAPLDALELSRRITEQAYKAGASLVTTLFTDEQATLSRFHYAPDESFDRAAEWLQEGVAAAYRSGAARLAITGADPALLAKEDPNKVSRANLAASK